LKTKNLFSRTLLSFFLIGANAAHANMLPLFEFDLAKLQSSTFTPQNPDQIKKFRVLIFPHNGKYTVPQGLDRTVSSVTITSPKNCEGRQAVKSELKEWSATGPILNSSASITFRITQPGSFYYHCSEPFTVHRSKNLTSYEYSGDFVAIVDSAFVKIINLIEPDLYLKGVVPTEVESTWPADTLQAQAVAARTYAWWTVLQTKSSDLFLNQNETYDIDDTVMYQAYTGKTKRQTSSDRAVDATAGETLRYHGDFIESFFAADAAGFTESSEQVFGLKLPYCVSKKEVYDVTKTKTQWSLSLSLKTLKNMLEPGSPDFDILPLSGMGDLKNIQVLAKNRDKSGRATQVTVTTTTGSFTIPAPDFRFLTKIRSTLFNVKVVDNQVEFEGKGYGHGVGMSQIGALQTVQQLHWNYKDVLKFYYPETDLVKK
jgi:stage II sporulation protein D